jgi:hypothetical protein
MTPPAKVDSRIDDADLAARVIGEFRDMPGLTITAAQAVRLFAIDRSRCERILDVLVRGGVLVTDGRIYARAGTGRRNI